MIHQKTSQHAIAAMSRLAEAFESPGVTVSARDIAQSRNLPAPIVAKILTELSRAGLISGSPGPGGGYRLARPPAEISLWDVVELFERDSESLCPYGPDWCGHGTPCPLHESINSVQQLVSAYLRSTHFGVFQNKSKPFSKVEATQLNNALEVPVNHSTTKASDLKSKLPRVPAKKK